MFYSHKLSGSSTPKSLKKSKKSESPSVSIIGLVSIKTFNLYQLHG